MKRLHALYTYLAIALGNLAGVQRGLWSARVFAAGRCWRSPGLQPAIALALAPTAARRGGGLGLLVGGRGQTDPSTMTGDCHSVVLAAFVEYPGITINSSGRYKPPDPAALVPS